MNYLTPILIIVALVAIGYVIRYVFDFYIIKFAKKTKTKIDDIIVGAIRTPLLFIFAVIGIGIALQYVPLPAQVAPYVPPICSILIAIAVVLCVTKILVGFVGMFPRIKPIAPTLQKVLKFIMAFIGLMVILNILGVSVTAPLAAFGIGGIAIALALQGTLSDFLAGVYIMADRPVRVGDYVQLEMGQKGYVIDIGWRSTKIRELPNNVIVIPNSKLAGSIVTNYYLPEQEMACLVQVGVSYDSDLEKVEKVTIDVAKKVLKEVQGGVGEFEPFIRYHTFSDFSINFTVILRVKEFVDKYLVTHEFVKELHKRYKKEGIEIPFPIRTIYTKKWKK
jgi:small-conductance mechanosensitive channel